MTRRLKAIEDDLSTARQEHQEAVATHQDAKATFAALAAKAKAGLGTAKAYAEAEDAVRFTQLAIDAKFEAIKPLEAEFLTAETERVADGFSATEAALRDDHVRAGADLQAAYERYVTTWRLHASHVSRVSTDVGTYGMASAGTSRVRSTARGVVIDGVEMRPLAVVDPLERLHQKHQERLLGGAPGVPKAMK